MVTAMVLLLQGCKTLNVAPVNAYCGAVAAADDGFMLASYYAGDVVGEGFANEYAATPGSTFCALMLTQRGAGLYDFAASGEGSVENVERDRRLLHMMNVSMVEYGKMLVRLAGGDPNAIQSARLTYGRYTASLSEARMSVNGDYKLLSAAFMDSANMYIENHQLSYLRQAIMDNQANIENYSSLCVDLIHLMRGDVLRYYNAASSQARQDWESGNRQQGVSELMALNRRVRSCLLVMKEMERLYRLLPAAHMEMSDCSKYPDIVAAIMREEQPELPAMTRLENSVVSLKAAINQ